MIHETSQFKIYFGDARDALSKTVDCVPTNNPLIGHQKFAQIATQIAVKDLACLNQIHSNCGIIVADQIPAFTYDGDFLITAQSNIGIGVLTADCLPVIMYDYKNHVAASVHAGWRGTVAGIAQEAVKMMQSSCGSQVQDLKIFFGPSAKVCCYQVNEEFEKNLQDFSYADRVVKKVNNAIYFDVPLFNALQLQHIGVQESAISYDYNLCTMCDHRFFSYRRQGEAAGRQMAIISLKY